MSGQARAAGEKQSTESGLILCLRGVSRQPQA